MLNLFFSVKWSTEARLVRSEKHSLSRCWGRKAFHSVWYWGQWRKIWTKVSYCQEILWSESCHWKLTFSILDRTFIFEQVFSGINRKGVEVIMQRAVKASIRQGLEDPSNSHYNFAERSLCFWWIVQRMWNEKHTLIII